MDGLHQPRTKAHILPILTNLLTRQSPTKQGHKTLTLKKKHNNKKL